MIVSGNDFIFQTDGCSYGNLSHLFRREEYVGVAPVDVDTAFPDYGLLDAWVNIFFRAYCKPSASIAGTVSLYRYHVVAFSHGRNIEGKLAVGKRHIGGLLLANEDLRHTGDILTFNGFGGSDSKPTRFGITG